MKPRKIIIDTDPGVDDAMAIAFAVAHPGLDLLGLTTVFGNVAVQLATSNALKLLDNFNASSVPVAAGASRPLVQDPLPHPDFVHGQDGLGNIDLPDSERQQLEMEAAHYIVDSANRFPGEITLIAVGPLTNVAAALALDPELPGKLDQLVIMGGALDEPGNVSPLAEANFLGDPHAADRVLAVDWPAVVVGLDVTHKIMLYDSDLKQLSDKAGAVGEVLWRASRFYVNYYSSTGAASELPEPGCAMHDAAALAYVLEPELFELVHGATRVVTEGIAIGQMTMNRKGYTYLLPHWQDLPATGCCVSVDAERVKSLFLDTLIAAA